MPNDLSFYRTATIVFATTEGCDAYDAGLRAERAIRRRIAGPDSDLPVSLPIHYPDPTISPGQCVIITATNLGTAFGTGYVAVEPTGKAWTERSQDDPGSHGDALARRLEAEIRRLLAKLHEGNHG